MIEITEGLWRLIFQSDCEAVVQTMIDGGFSATASTNIFQDCALMAQGTKQKMVEQLLSLTPVNTCIDWALPI